MSVARDVLNHRANSYKSSAKTLLTSQRGLMHRRNRPIEPEACFGNIKFNHGFKVLVLEKPASYFLLLLQGLKDSAELIRTRSVSISAGDTVESADSLINRHSLDQSSDSLCISIAATSIYDLHDYIALDLYLDLIGADLCTRGRNDISHSIPKFIAYDLKVIG